MMIMRPPQHGHGCESVGGSLVSTASASSAWVCGAGAASSSRARAMLPAREALAPEVVGGQLKFYLTELLVVASKNAL